MHPIQIARESLLIFYNDIKWVEASEPGFVEDIKESIEIFKTLSDFIDKFSDSGLKEARMSLSNAKLERPTCAKVLDSLHVLFEDYISTIGKESTSELVNVKRYLDNFVGTLSGIRDEIESTGNVGPKSVYGYNRSWESLCDYLNHIWPGITETETEMEKKEMETENITETKKPTEVDYINTNTDNLFDHFVEILKESFKEVARRVTGDKGRNLIIRIRMGIQHGDINVSMNTNSFVDGYPFDQIKEKIDVNTVINNIWDIITSNTDDVSHDGVVIGMNGGILKPENMSNLSRIMLNSKLVIMEVMTSLFNMTKFTEDDHIFEKMESAFETRIPGIIIYEENDSMNDLLERSMMSSNKLVVNDEVGSALVKIKKMLYVIKFFFEKTYMGAVRTEDIESVVSEVKSISLVKDMTETANKEFHEYGDNLFIRSKFPDAFENENDFAKALKRGRSGVVSAGEKIHNSTVNDQEVGDYEGLFETIFNFKKKIWMHRSFNDEKKARGNFRDYLDNLIENVKSDPNSLDPVIIGVYDNKKSGREEKWLIAGNSRSMVSAYLGLEIPCIFIPLAGRINDEIPDVNTVVNWTKEDPGDGMPRDEKLKRYLYSNDVEIQEEKLNEMLKTAGISDVNIVRQVGDILKLSDSLGDITMLRNLKDMLKILSDVITKAMNKKPDGNVKMDTSIAKAVGKQAIISRELDKIDN